jgi:adenylate cyclase
MRGTQDARIAGVRTSAEVASLVPWLHQQALRGVAGGTVLKALCERLIRAGFEIQRAVVGSLVFHPQYDAINFTWTPDTVEVERHPIRRTDILQCPTPFFHLHSTGNTELRQRLDETNKPLPFSFFERLQNLGFTDYIAFFESFGTSADPALWQDLPCGTTMHEGVTSSFATIRPGGFTEDEIDVLRALATPLAVAVKGASLLEMAETLLTTYLGTASGRSVMRGQVRRGQGRVVHAIVWHSDLRDSTILAASVPLETYLAVLNTYYDCIVDAVTGQGGEVLKFTGDGVLAMFPFDAGTQAGVEACERALAAARDVVERLEKVNAERSEKGLGKIRCGIALHAGDVMYGNVGSAHRLDFTVTGPTVNEVVRLESVCKTLDRPLVVSDVVASLSGKPLEYLDLYLLQGVARPMPVFCLPEQNDQQPSRTEPSARATLPGGVRQTAQDPPRRRVFAMPEPMTWNERERTVAVLPPRAACPLAALRSDSGATESGSESYHPTEAAAV